jgi:hypothetical protein
MEVHGLAVDITTLKNRFNEIVQLIIIYSRRTKDLSPPTVW